MSVRFILLFLFNLPIFSYACGLKHIDKSKEPIIGEVSLNIYISKGTVIFGTENIHNAEIIKIRHIEKKAIKKVSKVKISQEITAEFSQKKAVEKGEKRKIKEKVNFSFSSNSNEDSNYSKKSKYFFQLFFFPINILQKVTVSLLGLHQIVVIKLTLKKEKYLTSLSYLQFGKFRSSPLRAPPKYSYNVFFTTIYLLLLLKKLIFILFPNFIFGFFKYII